MNHEIDHSFPRKRLYGDRKIDWLLDYVEFKLDRPLEGAEKWNRIYARHLVAKIGMGKIKDSLDLHLSPKSWWFDKIKQFSTIYRHWDKITNDVVK